MNEHTCSAWLADQSSDKNLNCPLCRAQDSVECTCPNWWFPPDVQEKARKLAHGFGGVIAPTQLVRKQATNKRIYSLV